MESLEEIEADAQMSQLEFGSDGLVFQRVSGVEYPSFHISGFEAGLSRIMIELYS
jgi:hypothetical protein